MMPHSGSDSTYPTVQISGTTSDKLKNVPLFADLPEKDLQDLADALTLEHLKKGEMLFKE